MAIRSEQGKCLIHDAMLGAEVADLGIPSQLCVAPILHKGRLNPSTTTEHRELIPGHVADADQGGLSSSLQIL